MSDSDSSADEYVLDGEAQHHDRAVYAATMRVRDAHAAAGGPNLHLTEAIDHLIWIVTGDHGAETGPVDYDPENAS